MQQFRILTLLLLLGTALAVPTGQRSSPSTECRRNCPASPLQKLSYQQGKTYHYHLQSQQTVKVEGISEQEAELQWSADVEVTYETPCQVSLRVRNPRLQGQEPSRSFVSDMTAHPIRAVVTDGVVHQVCVSEQDTTEAINVKKGILSTLQNSLPSNSSSHTGMKLKETDIVGICHTVYKVSNEGSRVTVEKTKDHRLCTERYSYPRLSPVSAMYLKSPHMFKKSQSKCVQQIEEGVIKRTDCLDENIITPMIGIKKSAVTEQKSTLTLKSVSSANSHPSIPEVRKTSLLYDFAVSQGNHSAIPEMESKLSKLSQSIKTPQLSNKSAELFSELIHLMNQVPESSIESGLQKAKQQGCESLYLDAVAATTNTGAVRVMANEIVAGRRILEYTLRLFYFPRPCKHSVSAVKPLLRRDLAAPVKLAAGVVVRTYCRTEAKRTQEPCERVPEVQEVMQVIASKLSSSCKQSKQQETERKEAITLLKVAGNIRRMNQELESSILACLEDSSVADGVKVAAADALRAMPCKTKVVKKLLSVARDSSKPADVRIFAYKAGIQCANTSDISHLLDVVTTDYNLHVRSYILSDLTNLQATTSPRKVEIRHKLAPFNISQAYTWNPINNSLNYELSRFTESKIFGSELTLDIVHDLTAMMPIDLRTNFTLDLFREFTNVAEMGVRVENVPALIKKLFREGSRIGDSSIGTVLRNLVNQLPQAGQTGRLDGFLKIFGNEVMFSSITTKGNYEKDILFEVIHAVSNVYNKMKAGLTIHSVRGFQARYVMHVPTIQGIPVIVMRDMSAVLNLQAKPASQEKTVELAPTVSVMTKFFVGYKFGPSVGIKSKNTVASSTDIKVSVKMTGNGLTTKIDMPQQDLEVIQGKSETYMCVQKPGQPEQKVRHSTKNPKVANKQCKPYSSLGVEVCYDYSLTNLLQENDFPLVEPQHVKLVIKKVNPQTQGFEIAFAKKQVQPKVYEVKVAVPGHSDPVKLAVDALVDTQSQKMQFALVSKYNAKTRGFKLQQSVSSSGESFEMTHELFTGLKSVTEQGQEAVRSKISADQSRASIVFKTMGPLDDKLRADIDVEAKYSPSSKRLEHIDWKKFDIMAAYRQYQSEIYIKNTHSTPQSKQYETKLALKSHQSTVFEISGKSDVKKLNSGFESESDIKYSLSEDQKSVKAILRCVPGDHYVKVDLSEQGTKKVASFVASSKGHEQENRILLDVQVPVRDIKFKVSSKLDASKNYALTMTKNDRDVLVVRGPLEIEWSRSEKKINAQLGVRLPTKAMSYHVDTKLEATPRTKLVKLSVNREGQQVIDILYDYTRTSSSVSFESKIKQRNNWNTQVKLESGSQNLDVTVDAKMPVITEREIRGTFKTQFSSSRKGHFSTRFSFDAQRQPEKSVSASGSFNAEDPRHINVEGTAETKDHKYQFDVSNYWKATSYKDIESTVTVDIRRDSSPYVEFKSDVAYTKTPSATRMNSFQVLQTPTRKVYELKNNVVSSYESSWRKYKQDSHVKTPQWGKLEIKSEWTPSPSSGHVSTKLTIARTPRQQPTERLVAQGDLTTSQQYRTIEQGTIKVEIDVPGKRINLDMSEDARSGQSSISMRKNDQVKFQLSSTRSGNPGNKRIEVKVTTPSGESKISGRYNHQMKSLTVIPDISQQSKKYEMAVSNEMSRYGNKKHLSVEFHHNQRQKRVSGEWQRGEQGLQSKLELDVMAQQGKLVTIKIAGKSFDQGITQFTVETVSNRGTQGPVLIVDVRNTTAEKSVVMSYKKSPSTRPYIYLSAKSVKQTPRERVVSIVLVSDNKKVIDIGGLVSSLHTYGCKGINLNATVKATSLPVYSVEVETCAPAFVKVIVGQKDSKERYIAKLGLRGRVHAEVSLMRNTREPSTMLWGIVSGYSTQHEEHPILALSAKLEKPITLALRSQFSKSNLQRTMEEVKQLYNRDSQPLTQIFSEICQKVCNDLQEKIPEMSQFVESMHEFIRSIKESNYIENLLEKAAKVIEYVSDVAERASQILRRLSKQIEAALEIIFDSREAMKKKYLEIVEVVEHKIRSWTNSVMGVDIIEATKNMPSLISEKLRTLIDSQCSYSSSYCSELKQSLSYFLQQLKKDVKSAAKLILHDPSTQYEKSMLRHYLNILSRKQFSKFAENLIVMLAPQNIGILTQKSGIQVNLPLSQPIGSVLSSPAFIGFRHGIHYFKTIGVSRITTVNNQQLKLPSSRCEYILTEGQGEILTFGNLTQPDYALSVRNTEHLVQIYMQKKQLFVDGELWSRSEARQKLGPGITVLKRDNYVAIMTSEFSLFANMNIDSSVTLMLRQAKGLVWQKYPNPDDSQALLQEWKQFLLDPSCSQ